MTPSNLPLKGRLFNECFMKINKEKPYLTANPGNYMLLKDLAKKNKQNMTEAEKYLWNYLRGNSLGVRFRKQQVIDDYIVDFVCLSKQLIIELDGGYHSEKEQMEFDRIRTEQLEYLGFRVIRFTNQEVFSNIEKVLEKIELSLNE